MAMFVGGKFQLASNFRIDQNANHNLEDNINPHRLPHHLRVPSRWLSSLSVQSQYVNGASGLLVSSLYSETLGSPSLFQTSLQPLNLGNPSVTMEKGKYSYDFEILINKLSSLPQRDSIARCLDISKNKSWAMLVWGIQDGFTSGKRLKKKLSSAAGHVEMHLIEGVSHFQMEGPAYDAQMN